MTRDPQAPVPESPPPGWAPWGTRRRMLLLAIVGPVLAVLVLALGTYLLATNRNGAALTAVGAALLVVWLVAIPIARRRQKI